MAYSMKDTKITINGKEAVPWADTDSDRLRVYGTGDNSVVFEGLPSTQRFKIAPSSGHFILSSDAGHKLRIYPVYSESSGDWMFRALQDSDTEAPVTASAHPEINTTALLTIGPDGARWTVAWRGQSTGIITHYQKRQTLVFDRPEPEITTWCGACTTERQADGSVLRRAFEHTTHRGEVTCDACIEAVDTPRIIPAVFTRR